MNTIDLNSYPEPPTTPPHIPYYLSQPPPIVRQPATFNLPVTPIQIKPYSPQPPFILRKPTNYLIDRHPNTFTNVRLSLNFDNMSIDD